jgi:hypothetical protein
VRLAEVVLAARSHIGADRPDEDEDDARYWDDLTAAAAALAGPVVAGEVEAVAWAVVSPKGALISLETERSEADEMLAEYGPTYAGSIRPLVYADTAKGGES